MEIIDNSPAWKAYLCICNINFFYYCINIYVCSMLLVQKMYLIIFSSYVSGSTYYCCSYYDSKSGQIGFLVPNYAQCFEIKALANFRYFFYIFHETKISFYVFFDFFALILMTFFHTFQQILRKKKIPWNKNCLFLYKNNSISRTPSILCTNNMIGMYLQIILLIRQTKLMDLL